MTEENRKPLGILIFGGLNFFFFGLFFLFISLIGFFLTTPDDLQKISTLFKQQGLIVEISYPQYRIACLLYILISLVFLTSGAGLMTKKIWARKLTIYFAFSLLLLTLISVLGAPALAGQALMQALYPIMLVLYFTNKKITQHFN